MPLSEQSPDHSEPAFKTTSKRTWERDAPTESPETHTGQPTELPFSETKSEDIKPNKPEQEVERRQAEARAAIEAASDPATRASEFVKGEIKPMFRNINRVYGSMRSYPPTGRWMRLARDYPAALTLVSERIAHRESPDIPVTELTAEQIKSMKPTVGRVSRLLGRRLGAKLDDYTEDKANQAIGQTANLILKTTDYLEKVPQPRQQFITELTDIYRGMIASKLAPLDYFTTVTRQLTNLRTQRPSNNLPAWAQAITENSHPMMVYAMQDFPLYPQGPLRKYAGEINLAGTEIAQGLEAFLRQQGVTDLPPARVPRPTGLMRDMAEQFASRKLESAQAQIPHVLTTITNALPENGPELAQGIREFAADIVALKASGKTDTEIDELLFGRRIPLKEQFKAFLLQH